MAGTSRQKMGASKPSCWESAGSCLLSELLGGVGVGALEMETEEDVEENNKWSEVMMRLAAQMAQSNGWDEQRLALLLGDGNFELQKARVGMVP